MPRRFRDAGESIYSFGDTFLVRCPRCERHAEVIPLPSAPATITQAVGLFPFGRNRGDRGKHGATLSPLPWAAESKTHATDMFAPRRCVCAHCGYVKEWRGKKISVGGAEASDWYFRYPLWLQTPCCGQILWVYNEPHLRFLEEFVAADLRERAPEKRRSHALTYAARLPRWMQVAANRDEVLRGLKRLRAMLDD